MRAFALLAGLALALGAAATPAQAKVGDKAWAECAWSKAPESAAAWLALPAPTWQSAYTDANVLLGHRLISLCDATAAIPLRPNRMPNWKGLAAALRRSKPKNEALTGGAGAPEILLCRSSLAKDGRSVTYLYEIVRRQSGADTISFQQYYDEVEGRALKLPQDLRIVPGDNTGGIERTCRPIGSKGELLDG